MGYAHDTSMRVAGDAPHPLNFATALCDSQGSTLDYYVCYDTHFKPPTSFRTVLGAAQDPLPPRLHIDHADQLPNNGTDASFPPPSRENLVV